MINATYKVCCHRDEKKDKGHKRCNPFTRVDGVNAQHRYHCNWDERRRRLDCLVQTTPRQVQHAYVCSIYESNDVDARRMAA